MRTFDDPVSTIEFEDLPRRGLLGGLTGDSQYDFQRSLAGFLSPDLAFDTEDLADMGKIQFVGLYVLHPDAARLDPSMGGRQVLRKIR